MVRQLHRLKALRLNHLPIGVHRDGGGLMLQVTAPDVASWIFEYSINKRLREMGLGSLANTSLADARDRADAARKLKAQGIDPIGQRERERKEAALAAARTITFKAAAQRHIDLNKYGWRNAKHRQQWTNTLETYAYPVLGHLPVTSIDTSLVLKVIEPIWVAKPDTASRIRGRIESVLDSAKARGEREGDNPARWRGHLANLLPKRSKVRRVKHRPAMPYDEPPSFMEELQADPAVDAAALTFVILTWTRTSELKGATWPEVDFEAATWTVPEGRIKGEAMHRVPLTRPALEILRRMYEKQSDADRKDGFLFPGRKAGRALHENSLLLERDIRCITGRQVMDGFTLKSSIALHKFVAEQVPEFHYVLYQLALGSRDDGLYP
jgi:integrase